MLAPPLARAEGQHVFVFRVFPALLLPTLVGRVRVAAHRVPETEKLNLQPRGDKPKLDSWSSQWGSQAFTYNEEFKELVAKRVKNEKARQNARAGVASVIPIIVASVTVHPGVAVIMVSRAAVQRALPLAPASLAAIVAGLIVQRNWLAIGNDVDIERFYPTAAELALLKNNR